MSAVNELFVYCLLFGGFAGILAGLFGIGGGLVLVPFFIWLFPRYGFDANYVAIMSVATSLATIIITSISSVIAHHRLGSVLWGTVYRLVPGIIVGAVLGSIIADYLPAKALKMIFAVFLFYVGIQMALKLKPKADGFRQSNVFFSFAGIVIGIVSAVLGIGGGTMIVPFLAKCNLAMRNAVAVSSACGIPIAIAGTISYAILGMGKKGLPVNSLGYVYLPAFLGVVVTSTLLAPVGAKLAYILPTDTLKRYFSVLLFVVAIDLVW